MVLDNLTKFSELEEIAFPYSQSKGICLGGGS